MAHQHVAGHPKNMYELLAQLFGQLWHDFKKITDKAEVSHLEDRSLFILVDRNNGLAVLPELVMRPDVSEFSLM